MEKEKITKEEVKTETGSLDIMSALSQEVQKVIGEAGEAAGREAEQELERILGEYEQKTKQILLKVREGTKSKTAEIAARLSEAIMLGVEQASARAVTGAVAEFGIRTGEITNRMQQSVDKEASQAMGRLVTGMGGVNKEAAEETAKDEKTAETSAQENGKESKAASKDDGIELQQGIECDDFNQWLSQ